MFLAMRTILIDTQDYSRTDRRMMARDLGDVCWLWDSVNKRAFASRRMSDFVIAVQKEMFRDHFFFDKMEKVELEPLSQNRWLRLTRSASRQLTRSRRTRFSHSLG
jgi:hypothetical protein